MFRKVRASVILTLLMATTVVGMMIVVMVTGDYKIHNGFRHAVSQAVSPVRVTYR